MQIPLVLEFLAVIIYLSQEQTMKQPEMTRILAVQTMKPSQSREERPPAPGKLGTDFHPQSFDAGVAGGPKN